MVVVGGQGWVRVVAGAAAALLFCVCQGGFFDKVTTRKYGTFSKDIWKKKVFQVKSVYVEKGDEKQPGTR